MSSVPNRAIQLKIEEWKKRLADLSKRNRLLNFQKDKFSTIEVLAPVASDVFEALVVEDRELPLANLETQQKEAQLGKFLKNLRQNANTILKDKGVNSLFVALGTLTWSFKDKPEELITSPIFLIPVKLGKTPRKEDYTILPSDEDAFINPVLQQKLDADFGIRLWQSDADQGLTYSEVLDLIRKDKDITQKLNWILEEETVYIGLFERSKAAMLQDLLYLEEHEEKIAENQIIRGLANDITAYQMPKKIEASKLDEQVDPEKVFQILDADSSQQVVIEVAKAGYSFVVQGPPGTGKSQTIANIIAELIGKKKRVLLVAEKPVALEVVFKSLKDRGLEDACLDLHHESTVNKSNFAKALKDTASRLSRRDEAQELRFLFHELCDCRQILNKHAIELHTPGSSLNLSAFDLYGELLKLRRDETPSMKFAIRNVESWSRQALLKAENLIDQLPQFMQFFREKEKTVWSQSQLISLDSGIRAELHNGIDNLRRGLTLGKSSGNQLRELFNIEAPSTLTDVEVLLIKVSHVAAVPLDAKEWLASIELPALQDSFLKLRNDVELIQNRQLLLEKKYNHKFFILDLLGLAERFRGYKSIFRIFKLQYWHDHKKIFNCLREKGRSSYLVYFLFSYRELRGDLERAAHYQKLLNCLTERTHLAQHALDELFNTGTPDLNSIEQILQWFYILQEHNLPLERVTAIIASTNRRREVLQLRQDLETSRNLIKEGFDFLQRHFPDPEEVVTASRIPLRNTSLDEVRAFLNTAESQLDLFQQELDYTNRVEELHAMGAGQFLDKLRESELSPDTWVSVFKKGIYEECLKYIYDNNPNLRVFSSDYHEKKILKFIQLDSQQHEVAKIRLRQIHADCWKVWSEQPDAREEQFILDRESQKKKKHKSIRQFIKEAPILVTTLKPCWLMSPLAVSEYIDPGAVQFDVVIFDEASQIRTQDAVPSIMRAKQVIIVGDSQQLPPTSFFQSIISDDDDEEEYQDIEKDKDAYESVLDESLKFMKLLNLEFHYRSQDESLIAFSNHNFYNSQLISFPNPVKDNTRGIQFHYLEGGIYERGGKKRQNIPEAEKVAQLALSHIQNNMHQSLGIIAFSKDQAKAIQEQINRLSTQEPSIQGLYQEFFNEDLDKFFLRSLEDIQGDERDVILLSFGYGPDSRGRFTQQFGPLNFSGGERRLNVAITRAKYKLVLIASIRADDLEPEGKREGVHKMQKYMRYAASGGQELDDNSREVESSTTSLFIEDVCHALRKRGYKIQTSVGRSNYPIDIAVIHSQRPDEFLLGIECDGETYGKYPTARDRDRLRQKF
jgi:superfamily I DNA and/or RNA helicase